MEMHDQPLDDWQQGIVEDWLATDGSGRYVNTACGVSLSRQNGKTFALKARIIAGLLLLGEVIIYTAHEVKTARKLFESLAADFDASGGYPDLAASVKTIRRANGQEEIECVDWQDDSGAWHKGGRIIFSARTKGAARGLTADCVFLDEAQECTDQQLAAILFTQAAGEKGSPQLIAIGTPPEDGIGGEVFAKMRRSALEGKQGACWHEWSVERLPSGDAELWDAIEACNPAYPRRISRSAIETEISAVALDYFARERLGMWPMEAEASDIERPITSDEWERCCGPADGERGITCFAVKVDSNDAIAYVAAACRTDGRPFVEIAKAVSTVNGLAATEELLSNLAKDAAEIVIDGYLSTNLEKRLVSRGISARAIRRPTAQEAIEAFVSFAMMAKGCEFTHSKQDGTDKAIAQCSKRPIGSGGFGWADGEDGRACCLEACALALHSALNTKRDPNRRSVIS